MFLAWFLTDYKGNKKNPARRRISQNFQVFYIHDFIWNNWHFFWYSLLNKPGTNELFKSWKNVVFMPLSTWKSVRKRNYLYWKSVFYLLFMLIKHNLVSLHPHKLKNAVFLTFKESFICETNKNFDVKNEKNVGINTSFLKKSRKKSDFFC